MPAVISQKRLRQTKSFIEKIKQNKLKKCLTSESDYDNIYLADANKISHQHSGQS